MRRSAGRIDGTPILNPGLCRHNLRFYRRTAASQNSYGEDVITETDLCTARGMVEPLQGRERELVQQRWAEARYKVTCVYFPGLQAADEIEVDSDYRLNIVDIGELGGQNRILELICRNYDDGTAH